MCRSNSLPTGSFPWILPMYLTSGLPIMCSYGDADTTITHKSRPWTDLPIEYKAVKFGYRALVALDKGETTKRYFSTYNFLTIKTLTVKIGSFRHDCGRQNRVVLDLAGSLALDSTVANYTDRCSSQIEICNKQYTLQRSSLSVPFCWCAVVTVQFYESAVYVMEQKKQLNHLRKTIS